MMVFQVQFTRRQGVRADNPQMDVIGNGNGTGRGKEIPVTLGREHKERQEQELTPTSRARTLQITTEGSLPPPPIIIPSPILKYGGISVPSVPAFPVMGRGAQSRSKE